MAQTERAGRRARRGWDHPTGPTREAIVFYLRDHPGASALELARAEGITPTAVRRHLGELAASGTVVSTTSPRRPPGGRGRPARGYELTAAGRAGFGHTYDGLARGALVALRRVGGDRAVEAFARERAGRILAGVSPLSGPADARGVHTVAEEVAAAFCEQGYAVIVDQSPKAVTLCHSHCPIEEVARDFPEICAAEQSLIGRLVGGRVTACAARPGTGRVCTVTIPLECPRPRAPAPPEKGKNN